MRQINLNELTTISGGASMGHWEEDGFHIVFTAYTPITLGGLSLGALATAYLIDMSSWGPLAEAAGLLSGGALCAVVAAFGYAWHQNLPSPLWG